MDDKSHLRGYQSKGFTCEEKTIVRNGKSSDLVYFNYKDKKGRIVSRSVYRIPKKKNEIAASKKQSFETVRTDKIACYAEKVGISKELLSKSIELYVLLFPERANCAGYRNLSNRFFTECLDALKGVDVESEFEERTRPIPFEYAISEEERRCKIVAFCKTNSISADELENAVKAYLERYPDKIETNGHKYYSERFLNACIRYQSASKT